jgi:thiamine-phosphate pyrophosphorylase
MPHLGHALNAHRGLYAIIDVEACGARSPIDVAAAVLEGGVAILQLRAKRSSDAEILSLGRQLRALCSQASVPFVLNDRPELAVELQADGVHLGQHDLPIAQARALTHAMTGRTAQGLGAFQIGVSTHSLEQASAAQANGADLIGFGPVFATQSKAQPDPVVGLAALAEVVRLVRIPVVAIGGIDLSNVADVAKTGVPLAAVIGAVCRAAEPARAARELHATLCGG